MTGSPERLVPLGAWREPAPEPAAPSSSPGVLLAQGAVALACAVAGLCVLVSGSLRDVISFPYSDTHGWAASALDAERSGDWLGYLWRPANAQRIPWARLAQAVFIETHGRAPAFWLIGAGLWGLGLGALGLLFLRSRADARVRLWLAAAAALLLTCSLLGEDFALPVFSVYLYAAGPACAAAGLWALSGGRVASPALWAALLCAALACGGNAAGLAIWPALAGAALLSGEAGAALWVLFGAGLACGVLVESGLGSPVGGGAATSTGAAGLLKMAVYMGEYCGLPWSRAPRSLLAGSLAGWLVAMAAAFGLAKAWRLRLEADRVASLRRCGVALALFGLATAVLATLGRVDELPEPIVPTRYSPFALLLQVGVLLLHADRIGRWAQRRPRATWAAATLAIALLVTADVRGARAIDKATRRIGAASRAFDAGRPSDLPMFPRPDVAHAVRRALAARGLPS